MVGPDGRIVTWNAGAERAKGYKASEIIGRHFSSFYTAEDVRAGRAERLLDLALKEGRVEDEGWRVRKDGSQFWANVTITAVRDAAGKLIGFGKVTRDLTEHRRADVALRHSEERLRLFIEAVQDYAIFMLDPEGSVITWNAGAERIKGYKASEIVGQHFSRFYPEEDVRGGKPAWELEVAGREGRFEDEGWRLRKDGSRFWANVIITALKDENGQLYGFGKVTRDFTDRMRSQEALQQANEQLANEVQERTRAERKLYESEQWLRRLSLHLLRTQDEERRRICTDLHDSLGQYLATLKINLDSLQPGRRPTEKQPHSQLAQCVSLTEEAIKEVRTISYLLYPPMLEELGLKSAIPWYLDGFTNRSGIKASLEINPDFGRLPRDVELSFFRVLQESLTNVHRHSGSPTVVIRLGQENGATVLEIEDEGKGLPTSMLNGDGTGLPITPGVGLRGMDERMRQLGGRVELRVGEKAAIVRAVVPVQQDRSHPSV